MKQVALTLALLISGQAIAQTMTPAMIEARGERAKFIECAKGFALDHSAEYREPNWLFMAGVMNTCDPYLERFLAMTRSNAAPLSQNQALMNLVLADAVADAKAAAASMLERAKSAHQSE
jgi:hypothetical protein